MKSRTKSILSDDQISRLVRANFGSTARPSHVHELKGGMFNSAYLLEGVGDFARIVLKVSVAPQTPILSYEKDIMATEVEVYRLIHEKTTVPAPKVIAQDLSGSVIEQGCFFMTALGGESMFKLQKKMSKSNFDMLKAELAGYMAQIHQIRGSYFGYFTQDPARQFPSWRLAYQHMIGMILDDGRRNGVKLPYERIENSVARHAGLLDVIQVPSLVDYDLWAGNIFLTKEDGQYKVEGIVDFERSFWGDPYADFASSFLMMSDVRQEPVFWNSYTTARGGEKSISGEDNIRIGLYKLYLWIIMVVETYRYNFPYNKFQESFSRALLQKALKSLESF